MNSYHISAVEKSRIDFVLEPGRWRSWANDFCGIIPQNVLNEGVLGSP
jgi:hypothetical protein